MIDPTFRNVNRLFVLSCKNGDNDHKRNSFDKYQMSLLEIKDFNALFDKKQFLINPQKTKKKRMKNLPKCQKVMNIQQKHK